MDEFVSALLDRVDSGFIPAEDDWYAPLIGDWVFDYTEPNGRTVRGEWLFSKVLKSTAIEDLFICPSRDTKGAALWLDGEYGAALRMYDRARRCYDMTYVCTKYTKRLEVRKANGRIKCTVLDASGEKWCFPNITAETFRWQNETYQADGTVRVNCMVSARRRDTNDR